MQKIQKTARTGFTLIEVILYVALLAIVLTGVVAVAWDMIYAQVRARTQQELAHQLRFAAERIRYEIRNSTTVTLVSATDISLAQTDALRNPTVIRLTSGRLQIGWGSAGSCPSTNPCYLTSDAVTISDLTFSDLSAGTLKNIGFVMTGTTTGSHKEFQNTQTLQSAAQVLSN